MERCVYMVLVCRPEVPMIHKLDEIWRRQSIEQELWLGPGGYPNYIKDESASTCRPVFATGGKIQLHNRNRTRRCDDTLCYYHITWKGVRHWTESGNIHTIQNESLTRGLSRSDIREWPAIRANRPSVLGLYMLSVAAARGTIILKAKIHCC
jgi:hypothetical protein